jgi:hypothetical protein
MVLQSSGYTNHEGGILMTQESTYDLNRWDARSTRLRAPVEAIFLPTARWGSQRPKQRQHRSAAVERQLVQGDYLHD